MKKTLALLLILLLAVSMLAACGKSDSSSQAPASDSSQPSADAPAPEETPEEEAEIAPEGGEPFAGGSFSKTVGSFTLNAEWIPFEEPLVVEDVFDAYLAVAGDSYYIITDGRVKEFSLKDNKFVLENELQIDEEYERICTDKNGILYVSRFMRDFIAFKDNEQIFSHKGPRNVAMHPSGEWGISWFSGPDVEIIFLRDGAMKTEAQKTAEIEVLRSVDINENYIFASGNPVESKQQAIFIYDLNGNHKMTLGGKEFGEPDCLGSITTTIETANGIMALDGNLRNLCFWQPDGTFIGTVSARDLFGTRYPWPSTAVLLPDGSILVGMIEERADESAKEFIVYRMTGF